MLLPLLALALSSTPTTPAVAPNDSWWKEAKFGMFIHWGLYAVPADSTDLKGNKSIGEWYLSNKQMQVADYEKFAPQFNPVKFDANAWVRKAKAAGMKYIVITTKHHDGFCMWDSKLSDYTITKATPFKRDPLKELSEACRKQGIRLGFYHSIMDWHHPDYTPRRPWDTRPTAGADMNRYIDTMKGQLHELLTGYGKINVIWFDGGWEHNAKELRSEEVNAMIRTTQPGILINDRNQLPADFSTPEQTIPADALPNGRDWETCMTLNDTWGYAKNDDNWKSVPDLVHKLCDIASKGGNFLLNVGPMATGEFPAATDDRLAGVGTWMKRNGAAIYGTTKSPFRRAPFDGRVTMKGNTMYLSVFNWPKDGQLTLRGLSTPIKSAKVLGGGRVSVNGNQIVAEPKTIDPIATVIEVKLAGAPVVVSEPIRPAADGTLSLGAGDAMLTGSLQTEQREGKTNIGFWTSMRDAVAWDIDVPAAGRYQATIEFASEAASAGSVIAVNGVKWTVPPTGGWGTFNVADIGPVELTSGRNPLTIKVVSMPNGAVMNLRRVLLRRLPL